MDDQEVLEIFRRHNSLLEGHFILSSGLHSDRYIQCALVLQFPKVAEQLGAALAAKLSHLGAVVVAAPALGGVLVAHEVARALGARALFTERQDGITTGGSTRETVQCVEEAGGRVVGVGALIDRSGGAVSLGLPKAALATILVHNYNPAECPLCKSGVPAVKPGSRSPK